jgi:hypothetical protein
VRERGKTYHPLGDDASVFHAGGEKMIAAVLALKKKIRIDTTALLRGVRTQSALDYMGTGGAAWNGRIIRLVSHITERRDAQCEVADAMWQQAVEIVKLEKLEGEPTVPPSTSVSIDTRCAW